MAQIKILDCTLRDGGYINEWNFGIDKIKSIAKNLILSKIDFIELGFLTKEKSTFQTALFNSFDEIKKITDEIQNFDNLCLMVQYSKFPLEEIIEKSPIKNIRVIFKKQDVINALAFCKKLKENGFNVFINPTYINQYSHNELINLISLINSINPFCMTLVDTLGMLKRSDIINLFKILDENLEKNISLGFHSHDNLGLAFLNAQALIELSKKRDLIIDSSLFGMGRGAGNIQSELLVKYLNDNYNKNYDILTILKIMREEIEPIYNLKPWGATVPYYLAALNHCHPNYAKVLEKKDLPIEKMDEILKNIPEDKKTEFDVDVIK